MLRYACSVGSRKIASTSLSFCHGSGALTSLHDPMDNETLANELARGGGALLQEAHQAVHLEKLTMQAEQRSKVAEGKAIAAVTAIGTSKSG